MGRFLRFVLLAVGSMTSQANASVNPPTCLSAYGNIWGEDRQEKLARKTIDGTKISSLENLKNAIASSGNGIKIVKGGDFSGWDFSGVKIDHICFEESKLAGSNWTGGGGNGLGFINADLTAASLKHADMPNILLRETKLTNVDASGANFLNGHFDGGWFKGNIAGWNLDGADMRGFTFECGITLDDGCPVYQGGDPVSAKGTDFSGAILHSFGLYDMALEGAVLANTTIGPAQLPDLEKASFRGDIIMRGGAHNIRITQRQAKAILADHIEREQVETGPSFACNKAATKVETIVCGEFASDLRAMDRDVAALYKQARAIKPAVRQSQRAWLKSRNNCADQEYPSDCVRLSYSERKGQLLGMLGDRQWLQRREEAYFADEILPLTPTFKQTELYQKISPALVGASRSEILVKHEADGLYTINGWSVGANAHTCSVSATMLYLDKDSGWYVATSEEENPTPVFRVYDGRIEIFANGRPDYEEYPNASNFLSCGMRASFSEMIRMELDDTAMAKIRSGLVERF